MASYDVLQVAAPFKALGNHGVRGGLSVALVHGFTGNPASLRPLAERLNQQGFGVDLPRLPGHGTHPKDMARTRYEDWRAEVARTVERLASASQAVALVGLSMGATLALDLASSGDREYLGLVCINPQILDRTGPMVKLAPWLERVLPMAPASLAGLRKDDIAKPGVSEHAYDWVPVAAGNSFIAQLPRIRGQAKDVRCPVLIAHSRQDHSVPPENSASLLGLLQNAEELWLERSFHVAPLDYDLELLVSHITEFFDRQLSRRSARE